MIYLSNIAKSPDDDRDYPYIPVLDVLPKSVDLRKYTGDIEDQGRVGSCTANAVVSACEAHLEASGKFSNLSRLFLYYNTRLDERRIGQEGAVLRDALKSARNLGICNEAIWPYTEDMTDVKPFPECYEVVRKVTRYERVPIDPDNFVVAMNAVKSALNEGFPVVYAAWITKQWMTMKGSLSDQRLKYMGLGTSQYPQIGAHAMCIVGYDDALDGFIVENSWGTVWGDSGYGVLPYTVLQDAFEIWAVRGFDNSTPIPQPAYKMHPVDVIDAYHKMGRTDVNDVDDPNVQYWARTVSSPIAIWECAKDILNHLIERERSKSVSYSQSAASVSRFGGKIWNLMVAQDQALNCLITLSDGDGQPDEMLSARAYRLRKQHPALIKWIDRMFFWEKFHCQSAYGVEMSRYQIPLEYRQ